MIRVGLEVSFAGGNPGQAAQVTGVGRVITELAKQLTRYPDLLVRTVGCFAGDWNPIVTDEQTARWVSQSLGGSPPFRRCYRSRLGLAERFSSIYTDWSGMGIGSRSATRTIPSLLTKLGMRVLRRTLQAGALPGIGTDNTDVFFATFRPPPTWLDPVLPRVIFIHDLYPLRCPEEAGQDVTGMLDQVLRAIVGCRDIVVVNSLFTRNDFCEFTDHPPERVHVAYLAADQRFRPISNPISLHVVRQKYGIGDQPYLLTVANPQPRKDLSTAIKAFAAAAHAMPEWDGQLILAGNAKAGWGYDAIRQTIADFPDLQDRIANIGTVDDNDLPAVYSGASAFLFTSRFEGFGLPVLEAMSCGVPVISSNATALPEVGGDAAIYCTPGDVNAFAHAIKTLVQDPTQLQKRQEAGIRQSANFSWNHFGEQIRDAIYHAADQPIHTRHPQVVAHDTTHSAARNSQT